MSDILVGKGDVQVSLLAKYGNRHGLIAGATGTGKSVSLMVLAEGFSRIGVPVFMADVKGDVSGLAIAGTSNEKIQARVQQIGITDYANEACPVTFWDLYGKKGHPIRTTVSEIGPVMLARMLNLSEVQEGVLSVVFHVADKEGLLLLDLDDLRAMLAHVGENAERIGREVGNVAPVPIAALQRADEVWEVLRLRGVGKVVGEVAVDLAEELLHLAAEAPVELRGEGAGRAVAAVDGDAHQAPELHVAHDGARRMRAPRDSLPS